jgi:transposase InsO family protein
VLDRHGLVKRGGGPRHRARGTPLSQGTLPNDLWCADFKGEFKLGNGRYCYPLTVTDHASRFLLLCEALDSTREDPAITAFERLFRERGLPLAIRSDNGVPFASPNALFNLSKLSVWWLRLGIAIERIKPGHPQQNGRHERMHLTLKKEATRPPSFNSLQQQARFDAFLREFNTERPHEAPRHEVPCRALRRFGTPLCRPARTDLSLPRSRRRHHILWPPLPTPQEDQHLCGVGRPEARHQGSRRRHLARQLHAL